MKTAYKNVDLFGEEEVWIKGGKSNKLQKSLLDYEGFVDKFEPKKTTDDCYTPTDVYAAILEFVSSNFDTSKCRVIRPFFPDGDYEAVDYKPNDIVIDNPPFSIISKIAGFYIKHGIKFFLFAPHLTLFSSDLNCTCVVCGASIIYENGANVKTSFLSNVLGDIKIMGAPELHEKLELINKNKAVSLPKYQYPPNVLTVSNLQKLVERGIAFSVEKSHVKHIRGLDDQKKHGKVLFGSGFLLSDKAAADKAAAEQDNVMVWKLSPREQNIISELG